MPIIRFQHVFYTLLLLAALCAFVIPARITETVSGNLKVLFYPVSLPTRAVLNGVGGRERLNDPRSNEELARENDLLRVRVANLTGQVAKLSELEAQRQTIGEIRPLCEPSAVVGNVSETAMRQELHIAMGTSQGAKSGQAVLYGSAAGGGVAGVIDRAQLGGSVVQLITDSRFRAEVGFARFTQNDTGALEFVMIATYACLARGDGKGALWITNLEAKIAENVGLAAGDWVILVDDQWPTALQRYRLGEIKSITPWSKGPGYVEIKVEPPQKLQRLNEVMVMVRDKGEMK